MMNELRELTGLNGVSGGEKAVLAYIKERILDAADKVYEDRLGNLIAVKHGFGPKVLLTARADTAGLIATSAEETGLLRVNVIGKPDLRAMIGATVLFENGVQGVFFADREKEIQIKDCFVDIGANTREEAAAHVPLGTFASFVAPFNQMGTRFSAGSMDNRAGCFCLMEALRRVKDPSCETYFAFTVRDVVGNQGTGFVCRETEPDYAIVIGTVEETEKEDPCSSAVRLGGGAAIKVCDSATVCSADIIEDLENLAARKGIRVQRSVFCNGIDESGALQKSGLGVKVGGIALPLRYPHSTVETVDRADVEAAISLIIAYLEK